MIGLTVILAAHGAGDGSAANERVLALAQRIEATMIGTRARAAFRRGTPSHTDVLRGLEGMPCVVVPVLTSDGFHARALREAVCALSTGTPVKIAEVLGTSPEIAVGVTGYLSASLLRLGIDAAKCTVLVIGHGTARNDHSRATTHAIAGRLGRDLGLVAGAGFIDDAPDIETALCSARPAETLVVVPWLLGGGPHAVVDVPGRVSRAATALGLWKHVVTLDPLGDPAVVGAAIEESVRRALGPRVALCVGAHSSELSRCEVEGDRSLVARNTTRRWASGAEFRA